MFVIAPAQQPVVAVFGKKYDFFPVRRIVLLDESGKVKAVLPADLIFNVGRKEVSTVKLTAGCVHTVDCDIAAAVGCNGQVWGWATAVYFDKNADTGISPFSRLCISELRPSASAPDIENIELWLYKNNSQSYKRLTNELQPGVLERLKSLADQTEVEPGDFVCLGTGLAVDDSSIEVKENDLLRVGASGIGMISMRVGG